MAVVSHQGVAGPFEFGNQAYTAFGFRAPALRGFRLTFTGSREREIDLIQVLAGGEAQDLSPGADLQPAAIPDGRLELRLQDSDPSAGETFGWEVSHSVMTIPGARRYQIRDVGCVGACSRVLPSNVTGGGLGGVGPPPLIALVGFKLFFGGIRGHELDRIGVWFTGNELNLALQDESVGLTDTFGYLVDFIVIPRGPVLDITTGIERGTATELETVPFPTPSRAHFVLTGWAFNFQPGDREILDIGVLREPNSFTVFYGDTGGGDPFDWRVEWAHLTPRVVVPA
jgi:hypothetical protein